MHTFGALLAPVALLLVAFGFYLLASAFAQPHAADSVLLLAASMILSLGFLLLSYLLRSAMSGEPPRRAAHRRPAQQEDLPVPPPMPAFKKDPQSDPSLAFHRIYVDSARIRR